MKLFIISVLSLSLLTATTAFAEPNYGKIFDGVEPCFTMYDLNNNKTVASYNSDACKERIAPCSTFKVALSVMGFDSGIMIDENNPKWEYKPYYPTVIKEHSQDHTPKSWMANSVVWYSQVFTQKLVMEKFQDYISKFSYGNRDVSGTAGKNNGLTDSWLNTSLKISADEQVEFLQKIINDKLPVSTKATKLTRDIMFVEELPNGWKLYGKTGSASVKNADGSKNHDHQIGWYVGWLEKSGQTYIFAVNLRDKQKFAEFGGGRAKALAKKIFTSLEVLQ